MVQSHAGAGYCLVKLPPSNLIRPHFPPRKQLHLCQSYSPPLPVVLPIFDLVLPIFDLPGEMSQFQKKGASKHLHRLLQRRTRRSSATEQEDPQIDERLTVTVQGQE